MTSQLEVSHVFHLSERPGRHVWGGAERHLRILLPALAARGVDVEAIVLATAPGPVTEPGLAELERAGVRVTRVERPAHRARWRAALGFAAQHLRLCRLLRRRRGRVVHLHLDLVAAPVAAFVAGCRSVLVTLHLDEEAWRAPAWRRWLALVDRRIARYVAISARVRDHYREVVPVADGRIAVVPYGIPQPAPSGATRKALGCADGTFVVGFVGRLVEQKNLFVLLDALLGVAGVDLVLVGDGPLRPALEAHAVARGRTNVRFLGAVEDAARLMPAFDLLCLPSRYEGLGLVLLEAMARGVPCLGSRTGAIPEVLGGGRYGFLADASEPAELRAAVLALRDDPARRDAVARAALAHVRSHHAVARMAEATCAVYADVARDGRARSARQARPGLPCGEPASRYGS